MLSDNPVFLSYPYTPIIPTYGEPAFKLTITQNKCIDAGDSCNTFTITLPNHCGTHVDAPAHFISSGKKISDYPANHFDFKNPYLLHYPAKPEELILFTQDQIDTIPPETDLVLIKTNFSRTNIDYSTRNPGIHRKNAARLYERCPQLRAIGMDIISLSSFQNRQHGRDSHHEFLKRDILLIEDMDFSPLTQSPKHVIALPLRVSDLDSAPCTVIAYL